METREQRPSPRRRAWAAARAAAHRPIRMTLLDERCVWIRPVTPDDKGRLTGLLAGMSERSRHLRFHTMRTGFTEAELRYLTELDFRNHIGWIAVPAEEKVDPAVGEARCVRDPHDATKAEFSFAVADAWQGCGLGTKLVELLQLSAFEQGISRLVGRVLPENVGAQHLFRRFGARAGRMSRGVLVKEIQPAAGGPRQIRRSRPTPAA